MEQNKKIKNKKVAELVDTLISHDDPLGSYTGRPEDPFEKPTQDADDL